MMRRRQLIESMATGLLIAPLALMAQQRTKRFRIGVLGIGAPEGAVSVTNAFKEAMHELGYVEGGNVDYEYRWAHGVADRLPSLAVELAQLRLDVIVAGNNPAIAAAKQAMSTIPIVMGIAVDPVRHGFIASLARPGGNITGVTNDHGREIHGKTLGLLKEMVPSLASVAVLAQHGLGYNPAGLESPARHLGLRLEIFDQVRSSDEIDAVFAAMRLARVDGYLAIGGPVLYTRRQRFAELALANRLPGIHYAEDYVHAGALASYATRLVERYRSAAAYVDKILKGAKPADLAVEEPSRFYLTINLKTAKALGLTIPQSVLLRADEVIR
jgi:putative ABC transport system substrate-binding protein